MQTFKYISERVVETKIVRIGTSSLGLCVVFLALKG